MIVAAVLAISLHQGAETESILAKEAALQAVVEVRAPAETIEEFLEKAEKATGIQLEVAPTIREDILILYSRAPWHQTLDKVARHFDWTWEKTETGYRLIQSNAQRTAELRMREEWILKPYLAWQELARKRINDNSTASSKEFEAFSKLFDDYYAHLNRERDEGNSNDLSVRRAWMSRLRETQTKLSVLSRKVSPTSNLVDHIVAAMTRPQFLELDRNTKTVFALMPTSWQLPMPPSSQSFARMTADYVRNTDPNRVRDPKKDAYNRELLLPEVWNRETGTPIGVRVKFKFTARPSGSDNHDFIVPEVSVLTSTGIRVSTSISPHNFELRQPGRAAPMPKHDRFDDRLEPTPELLDANASERGFLKSQVIEAFMNEGKNVNPVRPLASVMIEVAAAEGVNLISECYESGAWFASAPIPLSTTRQAFSQFGRLFQILPEPGRETWTFEGGWAGFRSKDWSLKRMAAAPLSRLFRTRDLLMSKSPSIDSLSEALAGLSDRQLENPVYRHIFARSPFGAFDVLDRARVAALRFWGSIPAASRHSIRTGQRVPFAGLTPAQQEHIRRFVFLSDSQNYANGGHFLQRDSGLESEERSWMLANWPGFPTEDIAKDHEPTQQLPNGIPLDSLIGFRSSYVDALEVSGKGWVKTMSESTTVYSDSHLIPESKMRPAKQERYYFTVWLSPTIAKAITQSFSIPGTGEFVPYAKLPEAIRRRLDKAHKILFPDRG